MKYLSFLIAFLLLTGCSLSPEQRAVIAARLWADAKHVLSEVALATLTNAVQQAANDGHIDFAHAASGALYATVNADNVRQIVLDATGGNLPQLADAAATVVRAQIDHGTGEQAAIQAVAAAIGSKAMNLSTSAK